MKFLLDMNLPIDWLDAFEARGIQATHWSQVGDIRATDDVIMQYADANNYVVFTHDLDFGAMLAASRSASPSVIQVRIHDMRPANIAERFFSVMAQFESELEEGALLVIDTHKNRVRLLPLIR